ncbi:sensor histidine kinase [Rhodococcus triatomae]|nr:two-component system sensor kinase [Rhodococcus triatomae BKS 15-14]
MARDDHQPPLTWWSNAWRMVAMLLISAIGWAPRVSYQWEYARWWFVLDVLLGIVAYIAVWWRRRHPVAVATLTNLTGVVSASSSGPAALAMVSLSTRRNWKEITPQVLLAFGCSALSEVFFRTPLEAESALLRYGAVVAIMGITVSWGMYIGSRRELLATWQARALSSEAEQRAKVSEARSMERARIAREMHDVLAHRISVVSMYAGALVYRDDLSRGEMRESAATIEENARMALSELREVLGVLRDGPGDADPELPQPGVQDIDSLVEETKTLGIRVHYECSTDLSTVSPRVGRTLYRCIQEALTNVRKHASDTTVTVRLDGDVGRGVDLVVDNPLPVGSPPPNLPTSGLGLIGLAERVELNGGHQKSGRSGGRFVLHVWLPWQT